MVCDKMEIKEILIEKIKNRQVVVGVIGMGYVGLPLAVETAEAGYITIGFDIQQSKVDMVNSGQSYIDDVDGTRLASLVKSGMFCAVSDFTRLKETDFIFICVPTPLDEHQQPDMSYIYKSTMMVAEYMKRDTIVVLESTTYPGTTEELVLPLLENNSGLKCSVDFYLGFSPERVDPGNKLFKTKNTPKIVGGVGNDATEVICEMYRNVLDSQVFEVSSPKVAEMEKLLENTYRNVNIGLINEFALICNKLGINVWEVIEAAKTKPYGFQAFYPGPGLGGHCIPLDPFYLTWKLREYDYQVKMIQASGEINNFMPRYIVDRCSHILNRFKKSINGSRILILGVAYKQDIADYRESPAIKVIEYLENAGAVIRFYDPFVDQFSHKGKEYYGLEYLTPSVLKEADLVVVTTAHTSVNYNLIQQNSTFVFDTRNAMKDIENRQNIELL